MRFKTWANKVQKTLKIIHTDLHSDKAVIWGNVYTNANHSQKPPVNNNKKLYFCTTENGVSRNSEIPLAIWTCNYSPQPRKAAQKRTG